MYRADDGAYVSEAGVLPGETGASSGVIGEYNEDGLERLGAGDEYASQRPGYSVGTVAHCWIGDDGA